MFDPVSKVRVQLLDCIRTAEDTSLDSRTRDAAARKIPSLQSRLRGLCGERWLTPYPTIEGNAA